MIRPLRRPGLALLATTLAGCAATPQGPGPEIAAAAEPPAAEATASTPAGVTLPQYRRLVLDNGAVILLMEKRDVPLVAFRAVLRGGAVADPAGKAGAASMLAALLEKGAGERDARSFAEAVASVGGELGAGAGLESLDLSGEFLARDADLMIELLADMLLRPKLDAEEFDKLRRRSIELIKAARDSDPRALISTYGEAFLFDGHPYGRPEGGSETTLANLTIDDVRAYHAAHVGADRLVLSVAGDFRLDAMERRLREALGGMGAAAGELPVIGEATRVAGRRVLLVDKPGATQSYFWIGNIGVARGYAHRAELALANTVFGGRFTSMLNTELRIKSGLSYGARSRLVRPSRPGSLAIVSFTRSDATAQAIDLALETLERLHSDGLDAPTLASARTYVLGQYPLGFETAQQLAGQLATLEFYGLGRSYVDDYSGQLGAASSASVAGVIGEVYPRADDLAFVVIGDGDAVRDSLARYGAVTEVSIDEPTFDATGAR